MYQQLTLAVSHHVGFYAAVGVITAITFGLTPTLLASLWARVLRLPATTVDALKKKKTFNYNKINESLLMGRVPISDATIDALKNVSSFID